MSEEGRKKIGTGERNLRGQHRGISQLEEEREEKEGGVTMLNPYGGLFVNY